MWRCSIAPCSGPNFHLKLFLPSLYNAVIPKLQSMGSAHNRKDWAFSSSFFLFNLTLCDNDSTLKQIKRCERTQHSDSPIHSNRSFVNKMALVIHPSEKWSRKYPGSPYTKNGSARMTRYTWSRRKSEKGKDVSWVSCTAVVTWQFLKAWRSWYLF